MKIKSNIRRAYDRRDPGQDYLKYFRVVRQWAKTKHNISSADLDMMLFLFSERLFTRDCFTDFAMTMSWDTERFNRMLKDEWIIIWRKRTGMESNLYELSFKGKRLVRSVYKKLNGEERLSDNYQNNPMFAKNASYTDKRYRRIVKKMNEAIKR
jgi:hypothetical protein